MARSTTINNGFFVGAATAVIALLFSLMWYVIYETIMAAVAEQLKRLIVLSPLFLVILVHYLSSDTSGGAMAVSMPWSVGSAWTVASVVVLLFLLISYRPSFNLLSV
ncbi:hypothetical protein QJS04_geneDACA017472 [Acorus gramineus]|uniref:NADH dehydrogenase subunit 6 n=1 Tax=Acorus gramineus TaxID=55184 RepID=A0AAV9AJ29_ACOGR|nr:hypothetical protein QJS04_geneDACA017472 [Acorus gramineus]